MDTTPFKDAIKQFYRDTFNVEYISDFDIDYYSDGDIYTFVSKFKLNQENKPITIFGQFGTIQEFTIFAINELKQRRFPTVDYFKLIHAENPDERDIRENTLKN